MLFMAAPFAHAAETQDPSNFDEKVQKNLTTIHSALWELQVCIPAIMFLHTLEIYMELKWITPLALQLGATEITRDYVKRIRPYLQELSKNGDPALSAQLKDMKTQLVSLKKTQQWGLLSLPLLMGTAMLMKAAQKEVRQRCHTVIDIMAESRFYIYTFFTISCLITNGVAMLKSFKFKELLKEYKEEYLSIKRNISARSTQLI